MIPTTWSKGNIIKLPKVRSHGHLDRYYFTLYTKQDFYITAVTKFFFSIRNIIEQCTEGQRELIINFIDFVKAVNGIHRDRLWKVLRRYGLSSKIVDLIN